MISNILSSMLARLLLAALFLLLVNLLSGLLAVELRYPSLWGGSDVFHEYAYPALYNWALLHLPSMLLLALLVFRLPTFTLSQVRRCQLLLLLGLVVLFFVEVKLPYGRLRHIPFALFLIVDVLLVLLFSLLFYPPVKTLVIVFLVAAILICLQWLSPITIGLQSDKSPAQADHEAIVSDSEEVGFFEEVSEYQRRDHVEYSAIVNETVGPDMGPSGAEICRQARQLVAEAGKDVVILLVHPWFQTERKYVHHAGKAYYDTEANWRCQFRYPEPSA